MTEQTAMIIEAPGSDLFIIDNTEANGSCLVYLQSWTKSSTALDVATGYFDIGALLGLDGNWQHLSKIRILMGADTSHRSRKAMLEAVSRRAAEELDQSLEDNKTENPFLRGVPSILSALRSRQIECRVYDRAKFHAKTFITHTEGGATSSRALVGSSNFTRPGLTTNIELNVQIQLPSHVLQLRQWYDSHWDNATDVTDQTTATVERHLEEHSPFDVYAKALQEYFRGHELTENEWDDTKSRLFPKLDRYQKEAYWALLDIARKHNGAFLCDGVGLGKTFVGLMLIERMILHEGKRVVLFAPKAAKEGVWEPHLRQWLPHIGGGADFSNLAVFSHTDLARQGDFPERFRRIAELADVVIIDEAHHFRNPGRRAADPTREPSRYYRLFDLLDNSVRAKTTFLLTATPINNRLADFRHMAELFTRRDEAFFARTLGVNNFRAHFNNLEKELRSVVGHDVSDVSEQMAEVQQLLSADTVFEALVVQRSRGYARESQIRETGKAAVFPDRKPPQVADYSIRATYGRLLEIFEAAFSRAAPLFTLPMYYPLYWYKGSDKNIDALEQGRQQQVVGLIRTQFLKRFESSVAAFELSCDRLLQKLLAFLEKNSEPGGEQNRLQRWKAQNARVLEYVMQRRSAYWADDAEEPDDEDIVSEEMLAAVEKLDRADYDVPEMINETFLDLAELARFLEETQQFEPKHDDKLKKLTRLLKSKELAGQKVLIFTEFADTARYLKQQLIAAGIDGVGQVDSGTKGNRADIIRAFAPYYNGSSSAALAAAGNREVRVLISTDVLSEGLNLQDASRMMNYDIHWNPVRLMQRIGRVDRRMNPATETQMVADHPEVAASRGKVSFWNFLPPAELNALLSLYATVTRKTLLISKTLGIEGKKLLTPEDDYEALRDFNQAYEGTRTAVEEMHLEYQALLKADPSLEARLRQLSGGVFSGRKRPAKGVRGVFFCFALPALDKILGEFTEEAGTTRWYLYDLDRRAILEEPGAIVANIRSKPETPRVCREDEPTLLDLRGKLERHIKNTYLKRIDAPIGVKPALRCWMELNEG